MTWAYGETPADYVMSDTACALFLSLRYHQLHPNYIARRLGELLHQMRPTAFDQLGHLRLQLEPWQMRELWDLKVPRPT